MSSGYERVENALSQLEHEVERQGLPSGSRMLQARLGRASDLGEVVMGIDHDGLIHLITRLPDDHSVFEPPVGGPLRAEWRSRETADGSQMLLLDVTCIDERIIPTLISLIGEMLDRVDATSRAAISELQEVLDSWRRTLQRLQARMSREAMRGLFGELTVVREIAAIDPGAVEFIWKGPFGGRHDFASRHSMEVKTYTGTGAPTVTVNGLDQLDAPPGGDLHLLALRVAEHDRGTTIDELAQEAMAAGVPRRVIAAAFEQLGFQLGSVEAVRFLIEEERLYLVDDDFPGLRRTRLEPGLLKGIDRVAFSIALDSAPEPLESSARGDVLARIIAR